MRARSAPGVLRPVFRRFRPVGRSGPPAILPDPELLPDHRPATRHELSGHQAGEVSSGSAPRPAQGRGSSHCRRLAPDADRGYLMTDTSKNAIQAMMKSFTDIVTPAVDPLDPIALEQLQSAVRYLEFLSERIDYIYDRERFELGHHVAMGEALAEEAEKAAPKIAAALAAGVEAGAQTYRQLGAGIPQMRDRTATLTATIRELVIAGQGT